MAVKVPFTVVVGVDYSEVSRLALHAALREASARSGAEVHVVHVEAETPSAPAAEGGGELVAEVALSQTSIDRAFSDALLQLHGFTTKEVTAFRAACPDLGTHLGRIVSHLRSQGSSKEIAQLASDLEADLVVVGTHGRTGLARLLLVSVAHGVVTHAPCPVLVVRPKQADLVPGIEPPCPRCVEERRKSGGAELWCEQHRTHGRRHTYYQNDRSATETNFPLVFDES